MDTNKPQSITDLLTSLLVKVCSNVNPSDVLVVAAHHEKQSISVDLTPGAIIELSEAAKQLGLTQSELFEAIAAKGWAWLVKELK